MTLMTLWTIIAANAGYRARVGIGYLPRLLQQSGQLKFFLWRGCSFLEPGQKVPESLRINRREMSQS